VKREAGLFKISPFTLIFRFHGSRLDILTMVAERDS